MCRIAGRFVGSCLLVRVCVGCAVVAFCLLLVVFCLVGLCLLFLLGSCFLVYVCVFVPSVVLWLSVYDRRLVLVASSVLVCVCFVFVCWLARACIDY